MLRKFLTVALCSVMFFSCLLTVTAEDTNDEFLSILDLYIGSEYTTKYNDGEPMTVLFTDVAFGADGKLEKFMYTNKTEEFQENLVGEGDSWEAYVSEGKAIIQQDDEIYDELSLFPDFNEVGAEEFGFRDAIIDAFCQFRESRLKSDYTDEWKNVSFLDFTVDGLSSPNYVAEENVYRFHANSMSLTFENEKYRYEFRCEQNEDDYLEDGLIITDKSDESKTNTLITSANHSITVGSDYVSVMFTTSPDHCGSGKEMEFLPVYVTVKAYANGNYSISTTEMHAGCDCGQSGYVTKNYTYTNELVGTRSAHSQMFVFDNDPTEFTTVFISNCWLVYANGEEVQITEDDAEIQTFKLTKAAAVVTDDANVGASEVESDIEAKVELKTTAVDEVASATEIEEIADELPATVEEVKYAEIDVLVNGVVTPNPTSAVSFKVDVANMFTTAQAANTTRQYYAVNNHGGTIETYGPFTADASGNITVTSDKFSLWAFYFRDTLVPVVPPTTPSYVVVNTADKD